MGSTFNSSPHQPLGPIPAHHPLRTRLKILGRAEVLDPREAPKLAQALTPPGREGATERLFRIQMEAYDWNCPHHITPRFTEEEVGQAIRPFQDRIAALEAERERMKP